MNKLLLVFCILFVIVNQVLGQSNSNLYKISTQFSLPENGGWDYLAVDELHNQLFVSHGNRTLVVDSKNGKVTHTIENTLGVHGIAIDLKDNKAFISCGKDSSMSVVDLTNYKLLAKVNIQGANPDAILYDSYSGKVVTFNAHSNNASVINAVTYKVEKIILLSSNPEFAVTDGKGKIYVNLEDKSAISEINSSTMEVEQTWSIAPGKEPSGLAIDTVNQLLFSVCSNNLLVIFSIKTGKIIDTLKIGSRVDGCVYDPILKRIFSSNGEGNMSIIQQKNANQFELLQPLTTAKGARTLCINTKTHHIYLPTAEFGDTPLPNKEKPRPRPSIKPDSFKVLDIEPIN